MQLYVVLAQQVVTANALRAALNVLGEDGKGGSAAIVSLPWSYDAGISIVHVLEGYETLVHALNVLIAEHVGHASGVAVLVDSIEPDALNAASEQASWDSLIAMLILTFPEIYWIFGNVAGASRLNEDRAKQWKEVAQLHSLEHLAKGQSRYPLFDPTGLRDWVRSTTNLTLATIDEPLIPERRLRAAVIDEERPYAVLHGYTAYRFSFRTEVITDWTLMKALFDDSASAHDFDLLLEDLSLKFPDRPRAIELFDLAKRGQILPRLDSTQPEREKSSHRIIVTSGPQGHAGASARATEDYLCRKATGKGAMLFKPVGGMFDLWRDAGMLRPVCWAVRFRQAIQGLVRKQQRAVPGRLHTAHGTHGRILRIAEALTRRAEATSGRTGNIETAVLGAVLSGDAFELSGSMTPTTAVNALVLKHRFEVEAECLFSGVEYHFNIRDRLAEIKAECATIACEFARTRAQVLAFNSEARILHAILMVLRGQGHFDEEQYVMARSRILHLYLWIFQNRSRYVFWIFIRYMTFLIESFPKFLLGIAAWVVALTFYFYWAGSCMQYSLIASAGDAVSSFFSLGPPITNPESDQKKALLVSWPYVIGVYGAILLGFVHLGAFVSHLYAVISRR